MFQQSPFAKVTTSRPLTLSGLLLLGALTGCGGDDSKPNEELPAGKTDSGKMPSRSGKPDLTIGIYNVDVQVVGEQLGLCFTSSKNQVTVRNQGTGNAGPYKLAFGLYDVTAKAIFGCEQPISGGTAGGATSQYSPQGKCCTIDADDLQAGHEVAMFACADSKKEVDESDEDNNCLQADPVTLFAPMNDPVKGLSAALQSPGQESFSIPLRRSLEGVQRARLDSGMAPAQPQRQEN